MSPSVKYDKRERAIVLKGDGRLSREQAKRLIAELADALVAEGMAPSFQRRAGDLRR